MTIAALPHGVLKMSADIPGLVETSTNVAVIETTSKGIVLATSQRSSVASELTEAVQTVVSIFQLGVDISCSDTGCPPVKINAKGIQGGEATISGQISSQFLSALLMTGPLAKGEIVLKIKDVAGK